MTRVNQIEQLFLLAGELLHVQTCEGAALPCIPPKRPALPGELQALRLHDTLDQ